MKIGLTFNLRSTSPTSPSGDGPEDAEEEFDSPVTIEALTAVLEDLGHEVRQLGDGMPMLRQLVDGYRPDLVFNFAEGSGSGTPAVKPRVPAVA